jgi:hypothetical protein
MLFNLVWIRCRNFLTSGWLKHSSLQTFLYYSHITALTFLIDLRSHFLKIVECVITTTFLAFFTTMVVEYVENCRMCNNNHLFSIFYNYGSGVCENKIYIKRKFYWKKLLFSSNCLKTDAEVVYNLLTIIMAVKMFGFTVSTELPYLMKHCLPCNVVILLCWCMRWGMTCSREPCHLQEAPGHGQQ